MLDGEGLCTLLVAKGRLLSITPGTAKSFQHKCGNLWLTSSNFLKLSVETDSEVVPTLKEERFCNWLLMSTTGTCWGNDSRHLLFPPQSYGSQTCLKIENKLMVLKTFSSTKPTSFSNCLYSGGELMTVEDIWWKALQWMQIGQESRTWADGGQRALTPKNSLLRSTWKSLRILDLQINLNMPQPTFI